MGWRNRRVRSQLGSAIKHADTLCSVLTEIALACDEDEMPDAVAFFGDWAEGMLGLLANLMKTWEAWYGELPAELESRPNVQVLLSVLRGGE